jgi:hypothetical protein
MNKLLYQRKETSPSSRVTLCSNVQRAIVAIALLVLAPAAAFAQYPGGGASGGTGSYPSYGSKGAIIGAIVGGTAAAGLLYWKFHKQSKMQGCLAGNGDTLVNEKDNHTYNLANKQNETLKPGERVELLGKKAKDASGELTFEVLKMSKDLGQCTTTTAEHRQ